MAKNKNTRTLSTDAADELGTVQDQQEEMATEQEGGATPAASGELADAELDANRIRDIPEGPTDEDTLTKDAFKQSTPEEVETFKEAFPEAAAAPVPVSADPASEGLSKGKKIRRTLTW